MNRGDHPARVRYCSDAGEPDNGGGPFQDHDVSPRMVKGRSILRLAQRVASVVSNSDIGAGDYPLLQPPTIQEMTMMNAWDRAPTRP